MSSARRRLPVLSAKAWWTLPTGASAVLVGVLALNAGAAAQPALEPRTPAQLLADLQQPTTRSLSGTVQLTTDLGLPNLPTNRGSSSEFSSLVTGSHTMRVWTDGPTRSRVALLGRGGESDLIRNGREVWVWSSRDQTAQHSTLPDSTSGSDKHATKSPGRSGDMPTTPQEAAERALAAIDDTTEVSVSSTASVAGRDAYQLNLTPKGGQSLIKQVTLAVDGQTHVPLRTQVFSTKIDKPAVDIGFTSVNFTAPDASTFTFTPPPGAKVEQKTAPDKATSHQADPKRTASPSARSTDGKPTVIGTGWERVVVTTLDSTAKKSLNAPADKSTSDPGLAQTLEALPKTSGRWGSGRVVDGTLFSAVLTDDGRFAVGAVPAERLTSALTTR